MGTLSGNDTGERDPSAHDASVDGANADFATAAPVALADEPLHVSEPPEAPTARVDFKSGVAGTLPEIAAIADGLVAVPVEAPARRIFGRRFLRDLAIGGLLVLLIHVFVVQVSVVRGLSMSPSLRDGDRLMVDRISYSVADVSRFDVVVLRYPKNPNVDFVKRVIGLPGDRVELRAGVLLVNGQTVPEEFAHIADVHASGEWTVPRDSFFVLGDNRPISCDSREFGMVERWLLKGKVRVCFWPLERFTFF